MFLKRRGSDKAPASRGKRMATSKKPKALIDAEKKIVDLEARLANSEKQKDSWCKSYQEEKAITDGLHDVLDDLGIRGYRDDNKYNRIPLPVRLFAWALKSKTEN
jgi:hypothetical protein